MKFEFVTNPSYRIFLALKDKKLFDELEDRIKRKSFNFQPYLGLAQLTSDVNFVATVEASEVSATEKVEIISALSMNRCKGENIEINPDFKYSSAIMPVEMIIDTEDTTVTPSPDGGLPKNRKTTEYAEVIYETTGKPITITVDSYIKVEGYGNILFL